MIGWKCEVDGEWHFLNTVILANAKIPWLGLREGPKSLDVRHLTLSSFLMGQPFRC
jgi:hypothetical protein